MLTIRDFQFDDEDYEAMARIWSTLYADQVISAEYARNHDTRRTPSGNASDLVAEWNGEIVGIGRIYQDFTRYHPDKYETLLTVHPEFWGRGIGTALWQKLETFALSHNAQTLRLRLREYHPHSQRFAQKHGFVEESRMWINKLETETADLGAWDDVMARVTEFGVTIRPMSDFTHLPDTNVRYHLLIWDCLQDVPFDEPLSWIDHPDWVERFRNAPTVMDEGTFIAIAPDGHWIGITQLRRAEDKTQLETGLTGVLAHWRRKGIAHALKLHAIQYAKTNDIAVIKTTNHTINEGMLAINQTLGFKKQPATINMAKTYE